MIFRQLEHKYGTMIAEEIILEAMTFLGRLPLAHFVYREREMCPRISCAHSTVWFSYLAEDDEIDAVQKSVKSIDSENYTIQLYGTGRYEYTEFVSSILEEIAREVERHEREMKVEQVRMFTEDQLGFDTGIIKRTRRLS